MLRNTRWGLSSAISEPELPRVEGAGQGPAPLRAAPGKGLLAHPGAVTRWLAPDPSILYPCAALPWAGIGQAIRFWAIERSCPWRSECRRSVLAKPRGLQALAAVAWRLRGHLRLCCTLLVYRGFSLFYFLDISKFPKHSILDDHEIQPGNLTPAAFLPLHIVSAMASQSKQPESSLHTRGLYTRLHCSLNLLSIKADHA